MAVELYNDGQHVCLAFCDLVDDEHDMAVQCNQFFVRDGGSGALIDPGGNMTYNGLLMGLQQHRAGVTVDYVLASHADPDIIASINKWFVATQCKVLISQIWSRFVPHFTTGRDVSRRIVGIPDEGMAIPLGRSQLIALPAHFLHAEGNFHFYDPVARILFSGDVGTSLVAHEIACSPVQDFDAHIGKMEGFHRRYMVSRKVCRLWADMVRKLDIEMIVPQHGQRFVGRRMVDRFIDWFADLECGVDLLGQNDFRIPRGLAQDPVAA